MHHHRVAAEAATLLDGLLDSEGNIRTKNSKGGVSWTEKIVLHHDRGGWVAGLKNYLFTEKTIFGQGGRGRHNLRKTYLLNYHFGPRMPTRTHAVTYTRLALRARGKSAEGVAEMDISGDEDGQ